MFTQVKFIVGLTSLCLIVTGLSGLLIPGDHSAGGHLSSARPELTVGTWSRTGDLNTARYFHTATLLLNGNILVVGGENEKDGTLKSAEIYDPGTRTWTLTQPLATARSRHTATLLRNGKVLVAGGYNSTGTLTTAELYDPVLKTWTPIGQFVEARREHTATLLRNNTLLLTGGGGSLNDAPLRKTTCLHTENGDWSSPTSPLNEGRFSHTATLLNDGNVLLTGGFGEALSRLSSCRIINYQNLQGGAWRLTQNPLNFSRSRHAATKLDDGRVFVTGGTGNTSRAEVYDPAKDSWELKSGSNDLRVERHTATLLVNGRIIVVGGLGPSGTIYKSTELYDPAADSWVRSGDLNTESRFSHTATLLSGGALLIAGGATANGIALKTAEIYTDNSPTVSISGSVVNITGQKFAPDTPANIQLEILQGSSYTFSATTKTNASGTYTFTGLIPGRTYRVTTDLSGATPDFRVTGPLTGIITGMDFIARFPLVNIGGVISDSSGNLIPGVTITIATLDQSGMGMPGSDLDKICLGGPCQSSSTGSYNIQVNKYGSYKISLIKSGYGFTYTGPTQPGGSYSAITFQNVFSLLAENYTAVTDRAPSVNLTSPPGGTFFRTSDSINLSATATDSDGSIKKVEFYYGGTNKIGEVTSAPFNYSWNSIKADTYQLTAVATDNAGMTTISSPVPIIVGNNSVTTTSAASYSNSPQAPEAIVAAFGSNLATASQSASSIPLPDILAGTTIRILDSQNVARTAPLFYVSPSQINYQIPSGTATGPAKILVSVNGSDYSVGDLSIVAVAPGLFAANSFGTGVAAAYLVRVKGNGSQVIEPVAQFNGSGFASLPIDLGPSSETVVLVLYGTGIRNRTSQSAVTVTIGGVNAPVSYASVAPGFIGLDQVNATIPRSLAGRNGEVDVIMTVDGKIANTLKVNIK